MTSVHGRIGVLALVAALAAPAWTPVARAARGTAAFAAAGNTVIDDAFIDDAVIDETTSQIQAAIATVVRQRMGQAITVHVSELRALPSSALRAVPDTVLRAVPDTLLRAVPDTVLRAVPDPGARTGRLVRFTLVSGTRRVGEAVARIDVRGPHARAVRAVPRDALLSSDDIETVNGEVPPVRFEPLPSARDTLGQRVRRAVSVGEAITAAVVAVPDAVRSGDEVRAVIRVGAIEAWGTARAWGSGRVGDVIRVTKGATRTAHRARIVAPGIVEIQ
jgi:flagella basal body P-ring formation protein FlgA